MDKPNLFIVGAPKCGTTSMYKYLQQHPDIFFSKVKEPGFFDTDHYRPNRRTLEEYLALFKTDSVYKYKGEASPMYLMSKEAPAEIEEFNSEARIIVMVRNPIEMVYSRYLQNLYNGIERFETFDKAINEEEKRRLNPKEQYRAGLPIQHLYYSECARYGEQYERYLKHFGRNQIHLIFFEDLKNNTQQVYNDVITFLDLQHFNAQLDHFNKASVNKFNSLHRFVKNPPKLVRKTARLFTSSKFRHSLYKFYRNWNSKKANKSYLDLDIKNAILENYISDIEKLESLSSRDLTSWKLINKA